MVNDSRIVPVQRIDYLSLLGTVLNYSALAAGGDAITVLAAGDVEGTFVLDTEGDAGTVLCNQPVKTLAIDSDTTAATVIFVAAYDFGGITLAGAEVEATVKADGITTYAAVLADGAVTVTALTPGA